VYIRIITYIRQQPNNQLLAVRRRQQRDLLIIRRILTIRIIKGKLYPLCIRIASTFLVLSIAGLSISLIISMPQLKKIVFKKWQRNRIMAINRPLEDAIQMRNLAHN
jgi:hypothetical protein